MPHRAFQLSALLAGHTDDVRSLASSPNGHLYSASRDSTVRIWSHAAAPHGWTETTRLEGYHQGFVNAVHWIPHSHKGLLVTGGQDALVHVWDLEQLDKPLTTLLGHSANVCSLHSSPDSTRIISSSWDSTARIWTRTDSSAATWECTHVLAGHKAAVWDAIWMDDKHVVTASADKLIKLWTADGVEKLLYKGHTEAVRALCKVAPEIFASVSNDCSVRIWTMGGDALTVLEGHDAFIYAIVAIPGSGEGFAANGAEDVESDGGLASAGEEGSVKIWADEDGECEQTILVPALSVWTLTMLPNGDLAIGCSDNRIWVFTRESSRFASADLQAEFDGLTALRATAKGPSVPKVVSASELAVDGSKEGEIKLVLNKEGKTIAHQWGTISSSWVELGEIVSDPSLVDGDPAPRAKTEHEGVMYDYVFSIDVSDDQPALKLPYNLHDDVQEVARAFVAKEKLPESYTDQIAQFIVFNST